MTLPNFLIVGAAKSGTSSLFQYLTQHPRIYGIPNIEPSFFAFEGKKVNFAGPGDEVLNRSIATEYNDYSALFERVTDEIAIGEKSVIYLHSEKAPSRIRHYIPNAKIIVILRNPVDRAISSFSHLVRDGFEGLSNFTDALSAEEKRVEDNWQHLWWYTRLGFYYESLVRYFDLFPREQIAIFTYDEFRSDPVGVLQNLFGYLGVDSTFVPDISFRYNVSGLPKSQLLHAFLMQPSLLKSGVKLLVPGYIREKMRLKIIAKNINPTKINIADSDRKFLRDLYREDILNTQSLIGKDLSAWLV